MLYPALSLICCIQKKCSEFSTLFLIAQYFQTKTLVSQQTQHAYNELWFFKDLLINSSSIKNYVFGWYCLVLTLSLFELQ